VVSTLKCHLRAPFESHASTGVFVERPLETLRIPRRRARFTKASVCLSGFNIGLRTPFDCQEQVGGWESFLHGINKAIRTFGFFEFFFKN
jgi:hypothetical protein